MSTSKLSNEAAIARLREAGFSPVGDYLGSAKRWEAECLKCGEVSSKSLFQYENFPCKYCSGKALSKDAATKLATQANFILLEPYVNSRTKTQATHLTCGRTFPVSWPAIRSGGGCGYCAGRKIDVSEANLRAHNMGLIPIDSYPKSRSKWRLQCKSCNRILQLDAGGVLKGHGCPYCAGVRVDESDAVEKMISASLKPMVPYPGGKIPWLCQCMKCGEFVTPRRDSILAGQNGCLFCSGRKWRSVEAKKIMHEANLMPIDNYPGVDSPWNSTCLICERSISPTFGTVLHGGSCRYCAGVAVDPIEATELMRKHGLSPLTDYPGATKPWKSKCNTCLKIVTPQYGKVASGEVTGCAYCSKKRVDEEDAIRVMREANLKPLEGFRGVHTPWKSQCDKCHQVVSPRFASVQNGSGCRFCAPYGLDLLKPATLYLIEHLEHRAAKIGIAESTSDRIETHIRYGWKVKQVWHFTTGESAGKAENAVLEYFRNDLKLPPFLRPSDMPQGGYTETISSSDLNVNRIDSIVGYFIAP